MGELLKLKTNKGEDSPAAVPESLTVTIQEISREFGEPRSTRSNLTHILRIIERSGKSPQSFASYLYEARSITRQQKAVKKRMPYFFSVLEDLTGIK